MTEQEMTYHVPVLLKESVDGLNIGNGGVFVDVTFGGGGHSREIMSRLDVNGHLYSFDKMRMRRRMRRGLMRRGSRL